MSRHNVTHARTAVGNGPIRTEDTPTTRTHEGGVAYRRDAQSELFLLAVANLGEDTFYENASERDRRFAELVRVVAVDDPAWTAGFLAWLRAEGNMRTASVVGGVEAARAMAAAGIPGGRQVVASVLQRADEPGEALAYHASTYGRAIPKPVKRGVADAVLRLYNERSLIKWDGGAHSYRFGDVIDLVHPSTGLPWQGDLFAHALDRRHNRDKPILETLTMLRARQTLMALPVPDRRRYIEGALRVAGLPTLREAGMTWESMAGWLQSPMDRAAWEAVIPDMGYMALLRNLRNFDEAGVSDAVAETVAAKLCDPERVANSRQFPMRFMSAYRAVGNLRWAHALEKALALSVRNIPRLTGRTLVLVDTSYSMDAAFSKDGTLKRWDAAVLFGVALAQRCDAADVVAYSDRAKQFPVRGGESVLRALDRWRESGYFIGGSTYTAAALTAYFARHDRVVLLTDEQHHGADPSTAIPEDVPLYTFNLAGYRPGGRAGRNRLSFGGLTDTAFRMIGHVEAGHAGRWPWVAAQDEGGR